MNNPSMDVAVSASNPLYQQNFGSSYSDDKDDSYEWASDRDYCPPSGAEDSEDDDDDYVNIDLPSEDEGHSLFPKTQEQ